MVNKNERKNNFATRLHFCHAKHSLTNSQPNDHLTSYTWMKRLHTQAMDINKSWGKNTSSGEIGEMTPTINKLCSLVGPSSIFHSVVMNFPGLRSQPMSWRNLSCFLYEANWNIIIFIWLIMEITSEWRQKGPHEILVGFRSVYTFLLLPIWYVKFQ
jgi:hypothetical protein